MKKAIYKVPDGKLLKIFLEDRQGKIGRIRITGDFFTYPEESIENLETALEGTSLQSTALTFRIQEYFMAHPTKLFGLDEESLVSTILSAQ
jgi:lipoate---protein ligase